MAKQPQLLFVDDEQLLHNVITRLFQREGIDVTCCSNGLQAVEALKTNTYDLVVTDFMMPDMDGLELLAHIRQEYPHLKVIMITAHGSLQHAVRTMKNGAIDYIPKPFSTTELLERIRSCLDQPAPQSPAGSSSSKAGESPSQRVRFIGEHPTVKRIKEMLPQVARNHAPVFIQGESGTGKEVLARLVHHSSDRSDGPFVAINCANLPIELVESHLFGHRKGAFTGAIEDMTGAFEKADGGTLLLDEITEIAPGVQAKLLRVLQEREIKRVGETDAKKVDVRIIATSNRNVSEVLSNHSFREDLYHRISVFPLSIPPLRERISDVPLLAEHFVDKYCTLYGLPDKQIAPELMQHFMSESWFGNVRSLENLVQRGVLLSADRDTIQRSDVMHDFFTDAQLSQTNQPKDLLSDQIMTIEEMEHIMILRALSESDNNQQIASERLGISARTIRNKLRKYREEGWDVPS
jgi:DNA-binding NtrC family response regulator